MGHHGLTPVEITHKERLSPSFVGFGDDPMKCSGVLLMGLDLTLLKSLGHQSSQSWRPPASQVGMAN